jgi:tetratricopeptide (TPR) repeat protein
MHEFREGVAPVLDTADLPAALRALEGDWPVSRLLLALRASGSEKDTLDVVRCLGLIGGSEAAYPLVALLGASSDAVAAAAEDALWSVWMRAGSTRAVGQLRQAARCNQDEDFDGAIRTLRLLVAAEPTFAEAHHQLGLAFHGLDALEDAEAAYREATRLNPLHFAAFAGLGHVRVARADLEGALARYRRAVHLNPRLRDIRELLPRLEAAVQRRVVA